MKRCSRLLPTIAAVLCAFGTVSSSFGAPPPTSFTYQGTLEQGGSPVDSAVDVRFTLWDDAAGGSQVGSPQSVMVTPEEGVFSASVDFGASAFEANQALWVQIEISPAGLGMFDDLGRQAIEGAPYALNTRGITVDAPGRVGIGGDSPDVILDSSLQINTNAPSLNGVNMLGFGDGTNPSLFTFESGFAPNGANNFISFSTPNQGTGDIMTWTTGGKVGIGTTSPEGIFQVNTPTSGLNGVNMLGFGDGDNSVQFFFESGFAGSGKNNYISLSDSIGTETGPVMTWDGGGNVGIGTTAPETTLDIVSSDPILQIRTTFLNGGALYLGNFNHGIARGFVGPDPNDIGLYTTSGDLYLSTDQRSESQFVLKDDGQVGIGQSSPQSKLHVRYGAFDSTGVIVEGTRSDPSIGVESTLSRGTAIRGVATSSTGTNFGVSGTADSVTGWGVFAFGRSGSTGTKSFMIDHPLAPLDAYLIHYSSESPEPLNTYSGNVVLNGNGVGVVQLPDYFESINTDFRYSLTPIGGPANLYVATEIQNNRFAIAGGSPGQKVSWQVTAKRNDVFVERRGAPVELMKGEEERGKLLMPELYDMPKEIGINFVEPSANTQR